MVRLTFAIIALLISASLLGIAWFLRGSPTFETLASILINLGTELFGIVVTVAVVDWLFERRRLQDRARELAWSVLHALERVVWVWQGGPRGLKTDEILGLISAVRPDDPLADCTRTLLINLGNRSREVLDKEPKSLGSLPGLTDALEELVSLRSLRDSGSSVSLRMVTEVLDSSTVNIAEVLGLPSQMLPSGLIRYRDAALETQESRYYDIRTEDS